MSERVRMNVVCTDEYDRNLLITAALDDVARARALQKGESAIWCDVLMSV